MNSILRLLLLGSSILVVPSLASAADAAANWKKDCQKCHAADGSASGPMGKKLKLRNYTDPAVQADMSDEDIIEAIKVGFKEDGTGKERMPSYAEKYSEEEIIALKELIRGMVKP